MEESCKTCRFYQPHKNGNGADLEVGFCRRYAPRHVSGVGTGYEEILWPTVTENDWCGEWEMWCKSNHLPDEGFIRKTEELKNIPLVPDDDLPF